MSTLIDTFVDWFSPVTLTEYTQEDSAPPGPASSADEEYERIMSSPIRRPNKSRCLVMQVLLNPPTIIRASQPILTEDCRSILEWVKSPRPVELHPNLYRVDLMARIYIFRCRKYREGVILYGIVVPRTLETRMELLDIQSKYLLEI